MLTAHLLGCIAADADISDFGREFSCSDDWHDAYWAYVEFHQVADKDFRQDACRSVVEHAIHHIDYGD